MSNDPSQHDRRRRFAAGGVGAVMLAAGAATGGQAVATSPAPTAMVAVRGTAYTFNTRDVIAGAEIHIVELPAATAVTADDGSYELAVPADAVITPFIVADGHGSIHHQTFDLASDADAGVLDGVNFQTPSMAVYDGLRGLIESYTGRDPLADGCVVVTTVGDPRLVGMPFDEFIRFAPHGVEGAEVVSEPEMPEPIYFNEQVVPDPAQVGTSIDGGVLWANVPAGVYEITATHPDHEFATVTVTCELGRVVNANPVRGVVALDGALPTTG